MSVLTCRKKAIHLARRRLPGHTFCPISPCCVRNAPPKRRSPLASLPVLCTVLLCLMLWCYSAAVSAAASTSASAGDLGGSAAAVAASISAAFSSLGSSLLGELLGTLCIAAALASRSAFLAASSQRRQRRAPAFLAASRSHAPAHSGTRLVGEALDASPVSTSAAAVL